MIDESLWLQLIECIRCGYGWRETWLRRISLQKKEEEKNRTSSPERIKKEMQQYGELKIRLEL